MAGRGGGRDERLRKQREYQRKYRKRVKAGRAPDRDEIARELLHYAITENLKRKRESELWQIADSVIERLVARGYDLEASQDVFIGIVDRYEAGWTFQRRVHLLQPREGDAGGDGKSRY
jgi:SOS response regulatory protein OraA/RecX